MRNRKEILEYLNIPEYSDDVIDVNKVVETAQRIEQEYEEELSEDSVGYGLLCDFESKPFVLEDCEIEKIIEINGIVVYKKLEDK